MKKIILLLSIVGLALLSLQALGEVHRNDCASAIQKNPYFCSDCRDNIAKYQKLLDDWSPLINDPNIMFVNFRCWNGETLRACANRAHNKGGEAIAVQGREKYYLYYGVYIDNKSGMVFVLMDEKGYENYLKENPSKRLGNFPTIQDRLLKARNISNKVKNYRFLDPDKGKFEYWRTMRDEWQDWYDSCCRRGTSSSSSPTVDFPKPYSPKTSKDKQKQKNKIPSYSDSNGGAGPDDELSRGSKKSGDKNLEPHF